MADDFKTWFRLIKIYAKMDLLWFLRDTKICIAQIFTDAVIVIADILGMVLLAQRFDGFGGFTRDETLLMLGCALFANGVNFLFFANNNAGQISRIIGRGQLDHVLIQPVKLHIHFLSNGIAPVSGLGPFIAGLGLTLYSIKQLNISMLYGLAVLFFGFAGCVIIQSFVHIISCIAFIAPYAAEEIAMDAKGIFTSLSPYPLGGLNGTAQIILCTVFPIGAVAWLPARIILGKTQTIQGIILITAVAGIFVCATLIIFRKGLNYYAKTSSPRYSSFGR